MEAETAEYADLSLGWLAKCALRVPIDDSREIWAVCLCWRW